MQLPVAVWRFMEGWVENQTSSFTLCYFIQPISPKNTGSMRVFKYSIQIWIPVYTVEGGIGGHVPFILTNLKAGKKMFKVQDWTKKNAVVDNIHLSSGWVKVH